MPRLIQAARTAAEEIASFVAIVFFCWAVYVGGALMMGAA